MKSKNGIPTGLIIGLVLAVIVFFSAFSLLSDETITVKYWQAKTNIPVDTVITNVGDYFEQVAVPENTPITNGIRVDKAFDGVELSGEQYLQDKTVFYPIRKDDFDIFNKLEVNVPVNEKQTSKSIPQDRRLSPIPLNSLNSLGGALKKGDRLDLTFLIEKKTNGENSQDVAVTALQGLEIFSLIYENNDQKVATETGALVPPSGVSVLMTPEQVERFAALSKKGFSVSLNTTSPVEYDTKGFTVEEILNSQVKDFYVEKSTNFTNDANSSSNENSIIGYVDANGKRFYVEPNHPKYNEISQKAESIKFDSVESAEVQGFVALSAN